MYKDKSESCSVVPNSLQPHGLYSPWYSPGQNTCGSVDKESTCNAGDPGLIPRLGRSTGEGIGYLLQYFGASLLVQLVKNTPDSLPDSSWVQSLSWEDILEKYSILVWRIPWTV